MPRYVRETSKLKEFAGILEDLGWKPDGMVMISALDRLAEFYNPTVIRTDSEEMAGIIDRMREDLEALAEGITVDRASLMKTHGLDPHNRSDSARVTSFLKESGLLQHKRAEPEQWVRRIAGPNGATAAGEAAAE